MHSSCSATGLRQGLAYFDYPANTLMLAVVESVGEGELVSRGSSQTVYTHVTLRDVEVLKGVEAPTSVVFHGGRAGSHTTKTEVQHGLAPGGRVLLAVLNEPADLGGPVPVAPAPLVRSSFPVTAADEVLLSGCWVAGDDVTSRDSTESVPSWSVGGEVARAAVAGELVSVAEVRSIVADMR